MQRVLEIDLNAQNNSERRMDIGLLILRGAALFLALTFGRQKLLAFVVFLRSGLPLGYFGFA